MARKKKADATPAQKVTAEIGVLNADTLTLTVPVSIVPSLLCAKGAQ